MAVETLARAMSEDELDDVIREACRVRGLLAYHTHDPRRSPPALSGAAARLTGVITASARDMNTCDGVNDAGGFA